MTISEPATFESLPYEIQYDIYTLLDVPSVCRAYVAFSPRPCAKPTADYLDTCSVTVTLDGLDVDSTDINYALLAQLPPCNVLVKATIGSWPYDAYQLNKVKVKSLDVEIVGDFWPSVNLYTNINHPIRALTLDSVTVDLRELSKDLYSLSTKNCRILGEDALESFTKLHELSIVQGDLPSYDPDLLILPPSIVKITLPEDCRIHEMDVPNLTTANVTSSTTLPWHQIERLEDCELPNVNCLSKLKSITITKSGPRTSFKQIDCPNLEIVAIAPTSVHPRDTDVSVLFTKLQMANLTELDVTTYLVPSLTPFKRLRKLRATLKEPITENLPMPATLESLQVATTFPVEGIPPQLKVFYVDIFERAIDVVVDSPNVRDMYVGYARNVTLSCPQLRLLELGTCRGKVSLDTPNLNKAVAYRSVKNDLSRLSMLSAVKMIDVKKLKDPVVFNHLRSVFLKDIHAESINVKADVVAIDGCRTYKLSVEADILTLDRYHGDVSNVTCRQLRTSYPNKALIRNVESLMCYPDHVLAKGLPPDQFVECSKLRRIILVGFHVNCTKKKPLVIPASVHALTLIDCYADELWLRFEDESQLQHLEIIYKKPNPSNHPLTIRKENLGLTKFPPSIYCPTGVDENMY